MQRDSPNNQNEEEEMTESHPATDNEPNFESDESLSVPDEDEAEALLGGEEDSQEESSLLVTNPSLSAIADRIEGFGSRDLARTILELIVRNSGQGMSLSLGAQSDPANGSDSDDSDDGPDFGFGFSTRRPSPPVNPCPDVSRIMGSRIHEELSLSNGHDKTKKNITKLISERENTKLCGRKRTGSNFSQADRVRLNDRFPPNKMQKMKNFRQKLFCGQYSTDGTVFLSACQDQHIRLFDTSNGRFKILRDILAKDVGWSVVDTAYSPDQRYLIYSSWSNYIHLCNIYGDYETHIPLDLRPTDSRFCAFSVGFSQDNTQILAGASDRCIYIYDRGSDKRSLKIAGHYDDVNAVSFADESSDILYSGSDDGLCKVWDRRELKESSPKPVGIFAGHTDGITYIDAKGDGRYLLSNSKDQTIKLWDMRHFSSKYSIKECVRVVSNSNWDYRWESEPRRLRRNSSINGDPSIMTYRGHSVLQTLVRARFSPAHTTEQKYIYAGCAAGNVVVYDILTGEIATKLKGHQKCVRDISWHPFEQTIMSSSWDGTIGRWQYSRPTDQDTKLESKRKRKESGQ